MKKILATMIGLAVGASLVHAQGFLQFSSGTSFNVTTNTGTFGNTSVPNSSAGFGTIVSGKTPTSGVAANTYDYALLYTPAGVGSATDLGNLADGDWVQLAVDLGGTPGAALFGTNTAIAGNFAGQGGSSSVQSIGINGDAFNNGTTYSIALVGWSANLGSSWSTVESELSSGAWSTIGSFGDVTSSVNPSSSTPGNTMVNLFGNSSLTLYSVAPIPEPTTLALAGLGGISMLFLRRRKS
jgi:hypothetical protein